MKIGSGLLKVVSCCIVFFLFLPLFVLISVSFTKTGYLKFPPQGFTFQWYLEFVQDPTYIRSITVSLLLALSSTLMAILIGIPVSLALSRYHFRGKGTLASFFLAPLVLPQVVIGAALVQYLSLVGLARSFVGLFLAHVVIVIPYIIRTVSANLVGFNRSLEEAAQDLGADGFQTFFLVTLPLIKPGVIAGALFAFVMSWINVEVSMFLTTGSLIPIPIKIFNYIQYNVDALIAAVSATTVYIALAITLIIDAVVGLEKFTEVGQK
jgi:putative spermidine/putrescine transport system permease protein